MVENYITLFGIVVQAKDDQPVPFAGLLWLKVLFTGLL
jgi:hypothetical protein